MTFQNFVKCNHTNWMDGNEINWKCDDFASIGKKIIFLLSFDSDQCRSIHFTFPRAKWIVGFFAPISFKKQKWIRYYIRMRFLSLMALFFALTIAYLLIFVIVVVVYIIVVFSFIQFENRWVFFSFAFVSCVGSLLFNTHYKA